MKEEEIVEVATYGQKYEAEFAREILLENGIESFIKAEAIEGVIYSFPGNYSVFVSSGDMERAAEILDSMVGSGEDEEGDDEEGPDAEK